MALTDKLKAIADAIRSKTGSSDVMTLDEMPEKIAAIESGSSPTTPYIEETYDEIGNLIEAKLVGHTKIRSYAFNGCSNLALTSLPEGITSIGNSAFNSCSKLALTSLPEGVTSIGSYAFYSCSNLAELTFKGTPSVISASTFTNCSNLKVINVPWSEGAVANAPWGATNATINYNYKE